MVRIRWPCGVLQGLVWCQSSVFPAEHNVRLQPKGCGRRGLSLQCQAGVLLPAARLHCVLLLFHHHFTNSSNNAPL